MPLTLGHTQTITSFNYDLKYTRFVKRLVIINFLVWIFVFESAINYVTYMIYHRNVWDIKIKAKCHVRSSLNYIFVVT